MKYTFKQITIGDILKIKEWKYKEGYMKDIFIKPYLDNYMRNKPLKGPGNCDGFAVYEGNILLGLFEFYVNDDIEIGLAINPEFVGKGLAKTFIKQGIDFGVINYNYKMDYVKLSVGIENLPAYKAYLKTGFVEIDRNKEEIMMQYKL